MNLWLMFDLAFPLGEADADLAPNWLCHCNSGPVIKLQRLNNITYVYNNQILDNMH